MTVNLNRVMLIGRVAGPVETYIVPASGKPIARFVLVTVERWEDRATGEKVERAEFHRVVVRNDNLAALAQRLLEPGTRVFVEGRNETRSYVSNGERKVITEVVLNRHKASLDVLNARAGSGDRAWTGEYDPAVNPPAYEAPWT